MSDTNRLSTHNLTNLRWPVAVWVTIFFAAFYSLLTQTHYFINADVAFLTQMALYGESGDLYTQYFEINPPLIVYIYRLFLLPYYLGDWSVVSSLRISMISYLLLISALSHYYVVRLQIKQPLIWVLAISLSLLFVLPAAFLQREHIIAASLILYLLMMACRLQARPCSILIQSITLTLAGIAVCLKPQYIVALVFLELYYLWLNRKILLLLRWQNIYLAMIGAIYIIYVYNFHPAYFSNVAPMASETYVAYFDDLESLLGRLALLSLLLFLPYRFLVQASTKKQVIKGIYVLVFAGFVAFLIGQAGFSYHLILVFTLLSIVLIASWLYVVTELTAHFSAKGLVQLLFLSAILFFVRHYHFIDINKVNLDRALTQLIAKDSRLPKELIEFNPFQSIYNATDKLVSPGQSIYAFSARLFVGHPIAIHLGQRWSGRFPVLWPLPESLKDPTDKSNKARLDLVNKIVTEDIEKSKPQIILVEMSTHLLRYPQGFDFIEHFSQYREFVDVFQHYQHSATYSAPESDWAIYVRKRNK